MARISSSAHVLVRSINPVDSRYRICIITGAINLHYTTYQLDGEVLKAVDYLQKNHIVALSPFSGRYPAYLLCPDYSPYWLIIR